MQKTCPQCQQTFRPRSKTQTYCSSTCLGASQRTPPKVCPICSTAFQPAKGAAQVFCGAQCLHTHRMTPKTRTCQFCAASYQAHANTSKFCSVACRQGNAKLATALHKDQVARRTEKAPKARAKRVAKGLLARPCEQCGEVYAPSHTYQSYCSVPCKDAAHSVRMKGKANSNFRHGLEVGAHSKTFKLDISRQVRKTYKACMQCGATTRLCTHHMDEVKTNDDWNNLACLCHSCHIRYHKTSDPELRASMTSLWKKTIASWPRDS